MIRIHVGRVLAVALLVLTALLVAAAVRSSPAGGGVASPLGEPAAAAQPASAAAEPAPPPPSGFKGTAWCSGLLQTADADVADACTAAIVLVHLFALFCCFLALAIICDDFLVPPIEHFCERYQIPDEAAGASFLAFGSSAPEIVIASIATLGGTDPDDPGGSETGLSTVLGSAVLAFGLIPAVSALLSPPPGASKRRSPRSATSHHSADQWDEHDLLFPPELAKGGLLLEMRPLVRDVSFAVIGFALIFLFGSDGVVVRWEALVLIGGFFVYMGVIFVPAAKLAKKAKASIAAANESTTSGASDTRMLGAAPATAIAAASPVPRPNALPTVVITNGASKVAEDPEQGGAVLQVAGTYVDGSAASTDSYGTFEAADCDDDEKHPTGCLEWIVEQLRRPIEWICEHTIPHEPEPGESTTVWLGCFRIGWVDNWYVIGFVMSLVYVSLLADLILESAKFACDAIGMSDDLEGVTVLAWGAQVPDCLASVAMAKKGLGPGAVANAVGSQIINVFIGLGLPYAIAGASLLNIHGVMVYLLCLFVCMLTFVVLCVAAMFYELPHCLGGVFAGHGRASSPILTPKSAKVLCAVWVICNVVIVVTDSSSSWDLLGEQYTAPRLGDYLV